MKATSEAFVLCNREDIELAWHAAWTTGQAPVLGGMLDALIMVLSPVDSRGREVGAQIRVDGGKMADILHKELRLSLGTLATYGTDLTSGAARSLLHSLESERSMIGDVAVVYDHRLAASHQE